MDARGASLIAGLFLALLTLSAAHPIVSAESTRIPGVNVGDIRVYEYNKTWTSSVPGAQPPNDWYSTVNLSIITVESISGSNVSVNATYVHNDFSIETVHAWIDVDSGNRSDYEKIEAFFIAANLTSGDMMYQRNVTHPITQTAMRTYLGINREVNEMDDMIMVWNLAEHRYYNVSLDYYWDRLSGSLLEMHKVWQSVDTNYSFNILIQQSYSIPESPPATLVLSLLLATTMVVAAARCREHKTMVKKSRIV